MWLSWYQMGIHSEASTFPNPQNVHIKFPCDVFSLYYSSVLFILLQWHLTKAKHPSVNQEMV